MYRVVVADDDSKTCKKAVEFLQNNGYQVVGEASDGLEAVMVCCREHPDFVIMDLSMPVMTGLEAIRVIRREKLAGFIIVLTSCRNKALLHQAAQEDIMGYLVKPVEESALLGAVEVALCQENHIMKAERECEKTKKALEDRKYIEKAKGLLMEHRKLSENEAYSHIRRQAMDKEQTMAEIARILLMAYNVQDKKC
ncbi:ANTAR domain-containing response regulator [uncultured Enterocloster sp.]|jgi:AmiR/NasT family two-component response regulator|uniref:ANTAR domain-containing response regulator n=1 Tax=Enterocloster sp. TaxID=2719315 RepID=UPI0025D7C134|nr:response regulator [uncultured Enterocloster sp.]